jgi:endonuclease G
LEGYKLNKALNFFVAGAIVGGIVLGVPLYVTASNRPAKVITQRVYDSSTWQLRSEHFVFGMPRPIDSRYDFDNPQTKEKATGISVLVREGFVVGHADRFKAPVWVAVHWTRDYFSQSEDARDSKRDFEVDTELPPYAQGQNRYNNSDYDRGHMARNKDNLAFGSDNTQMGDRMSNIVPQTKSLNQRIWAKLENEQRTIVNSDQIQEIWVISGALYSNMKPIKTVGNGIGVPNATYKIIGWFDENRIFHAQGFILPQNAADVQSQSYLASIKSIEEETGLDFFPELPAEESQRIEADKPSKLWDAP